MSKFKVGDIVVGLPGNGYNFTGEGSICKVTADFAAVMEVEVIKPSLYSDPDYRSIGKRYPVKVVGFKLQRHRLLENE